MALRLNIILCTLAALLLTGCYEESYDVETVSGQSGKTQMILTFVTSNSSSTRSAAEDPDGYEVGIGYEDDINISEHDYKIYFFTYNSSTKDAGTLIAEFTPTNISTSSTSSATTYTIMGSVPSELLSVSDFRVVMLANWGMWYPSVTVGKTTIDDLVEGANTTFNAFKKFVIDADNLIPFYGVQEYTGVTFAPNTTTTLSTPVSLLRAVAKVEVILTPDLSTDENGNANSNINEFSNVEIVNYNSQGYCAPIDVYTAEDYDTKMKNNPSSGNWSDEWVKDLHLVNGTNDVGTKSQTFTHISSYDGTSGSLDTWRIYLPEYYNMDTDYSYVQVYIDGAPFQINFAEYDEEGKTDNLNRYNLKRNNLYRFYVTVEGGYLRVHVKKWENTYENDFTYEGDTIYTDNPDPEDGDDPYGTDPE